MNISGIKELPKQLNIRRGFMFGTLIVTALIAFELFNYSTTDFALADLLGDLQFAGVRWATILAIAFCGIDFAGIARLFTPEQAQDGGATEVWYLFGAWMLAATMNATLTWWGVSIAIFNHTTLGNSFVSRDTLLQVVPVFVAVMVWLMRVLIIGTISVGGDRLFSQGEARVSAARRQRTTRSVREPVLVSKRPAVAAKSRVRTPAYKPGVNTRNHATPEPSYHPVSMSGNGSGRYGQQRF